MINFKRSKVAPPYPQVIRSETNRGYVKPRIIPNTKYKVIFVKYTKNGKV
jgi:hypothetical protein